MRRMEVTENSRCHYKDQSVNALKKNAAPCENHTFCIKNSEFLLLKQVTNNMVLYVPVCVRLATLE
jgi:hypothetical protein